MLFEIKGIVKKGDYLYAKVPDHPNRTKNNYVLLHRVIMENHINRLLLPNEVVHHRDKNRYNNDISNLELLTKEEHNHLHSEEKKKPWIQLVCPECGKVFFKRPNLFNWSKSKLHFCSRQCNGKYQQKHNWNNKKDKT